MALKRVPPERVKRPFRYERPLGLVRLHLDDLEDVVRIAGPPRTAGVTISAGNAEADTPDDLRNATSDELSRVGIVTSDPRVEVRLHKERADVSTAENSDAAKALVDDLHGLLTQRRARLLLDEATNLTIGLALFGVLVVQAYATGNPSIFVFGMLGLSLAVGAFFTARRAYGGARLVLTRRSERRGVSADARQKILIAVITAIVVAPVSVLVAVLAGRFK